MHDGTYSQVTNSSLVPASVGIHTKTLGKQSCSSWGIIFPLPMAHCHVALVIKLLNIILRAAPEGREGGESCFSKTGQASQKVLLWLSASAASPPHMRLVITTMVPLWSCHQTISVPSLACPNYLYATCMDQLKQTLSETAGFQPEEPIAHAAAEPVRAAGHAMRG